MTRLSMIALAAGLSGLATAAMAQQTNQPPPPSGPYQARQWVLHAASGQYQQAQTGGPSSMQPPGPYQQGQMGGRPPCSLRVRHTKGRGRLSRLRAPRPRPRGRRRAAAMAYGYGYGAPPPAYGYGGYPGPGYGGYPGYGYGGYPGYGYGGYGGYGYGGGPGAARAATAATGAAAASAACRRACSAAAAAATGAAAACPAWRGACSAAAAAAAGDGQPKNGEGPQGPRHRRIRRAGGARRGFAGKMSMRLSHKDDPDNWRCDAMTCKEENSEGGFVRVTAGRQRVAQRAHPQATFKPRGRATRPMRQSVSACRLGG